MPVDYLAAEELIITRLGPSGKNVTRHILSATDLAGVDEQKQLTPAVFVLYDGDRLGDSAGRNSGQMIYQKWLLIVAVRNVKGQKTGKGARDEAGPIITKVLDAMLGWSPGTDYQPMQRVVAPRPGYSPGGYAYFPLAFETRVTTGGTP